ncbi:DUF3048 domain-containing protein [Candidatus Daviesbacteria bacterium]|nr:DUF3048 domain-containing protein [Candidatus Daviesbacteria bacterium]
MDQINKLFAGLNNLQKTLVLAIIAIVVYAFSAGISYSLISSIGGKVGIPQISQTTTLPNAKGGGEDPSQPKTESCLLNGSMHTKAAKTAWDNHRPLAVMIENHQDARPQSGLSSADIVYEAVAEGGITRFMAVFLCELGDFQVGPVRSARTYFIDWLSEYDALYAHVGGANTSGPANALGQIIDYDILDLNQFSIGFPTFWRDYQRLGRPVATEHTMYSTTQKLWDVGVKRGWSATDSAGIRWDSKFIPWKFKDDQPGGTTTKIIVNFWDNKPDYQVEWDYSSDCNCYKRKNGGANHIDLDNNKQLSPKNVVVQFMVQSNANDGYENNAHLLYQDKGQAKALIFQDGKVVEGQWIKGSRLAREKFVDKLGKEISFNKGQIWIETVPQGSQVTY